MSFFGRWECPNCGTSWTGSIGWVMPDPEELPIMLQNMCGCTGRIKGAKTPSGSCSIMNAKISEKRLAMNLEIDKPRGKEEEPERAAKTQ